MIRISEFKSKATLKTAAMVSVFLLLAAVAGFGQQQINLTAAPTTTTLPDGTTEPMWGYFCGAAVSGSTATCAAANPSSATNPLAQTWSPVVITVPTGQGLTINLTNNLSFANGTGTNNTVPTSIVIVGQVGGGLGTQRTTTPSPSHVDAQGCQTWFIANTQPGQPCNPSTPLASPPVQAQRVQSMATEVGAGVTTPLTWAFLKPGTYLLESGTHPSIQVPMGLIGVLVVTTAPSGTTAGTAYPAVGTAPAVPYNAELPLVFSEIDPVQNKEVDQAVRTVGFSETAVWTRMNAFGPVTGLTLGNSGSGYTSAPMVTIAPPTTAGLSTGTTAEAIATLAFEVASQPLVASGGSGYTAGDALTLVGGTGTAATATVATVDGSGAILTLSAFTPGSYTTAPTSPVSVTGGTGTLATLNATFTGFVSGVTLTNAGDGYTAAPLVTIGAPTTGTNQATATAAITLGGCGNGATHTCYPPAVNYTPFYYLINGVAFSKDNPAFSAFPATAGLNTTTTPPTPVTTGISGTVLVRVVNAGLRLHVPSIVGSLTQGFNGGGTSATVGGFTLIAEDGNVIPGVAPAGAASVPANPRVQTDVLMVPSKVYDLLVNVPALPAAATATPALPIYDRALSLSANSSVRDAGMLAYISVNNSTASAGLPVTPGTGIFAAAQANPDTYNSLVCPGSPCAQTQPFSVSDPSKGVLANDINVYGAVLVTPPTNGTVTCGLVVTINDGAQQICANGTFTYTPNPGSTATTDSFTYCASNGFVPPASCPSANLAATVTLGPSGLTTGSVTANNTSYTAKMATFLKIPSPGLLMNVQDSNNLPLQVVLSSVTTPAGSTLTLNMDPQGGFTASVPAAGSYTFTFQAQNSIGTTSNSATVTLNFPVGSGLTVNVVDAQAYNNCQGNSACISGLPPITDYRWIIEEDKTFWIDPNCTTNLSGNGSGTYTPPPGCPGVVPGASGTTTIPMFAVNFHTDWMNFVAQGCTGEQSCEWGQTMLDTRPACTAPNVPVGCSATAGTHIPAVCDLGNGACRPDPGDGTTSGGFTWVNPSQVALDPTKRYYISVLPGDAANPFPSYLGPPGCNPQTGAQGTNPCGHTMSGAPIPPACNILLPGCSSTSQIAFAPVNVLALPTPLPTGKLSVIVFEDDFPLNGEQDAGGGVDVLSPNEPGLGGFEIVLWDTYGGLGDVTGQDSFDMFNMPLSNSLAGTIDPATGNDACPISTQITSNVLGGAGNGPNSQTGITGRIVTCPKYESDGTTLSPLAGQAVVANLMPEKFSVQAYPGADRIANGEEWLQTNTLDGQHPHDSFIRIGEPSYFQEYGPAGYHVSIGFANPAIINARHDAVCTGTFGAVGPCNNTIEGQVNMERLSRTPDQRLYPSGSHDAFAWTQCWVSLGDPDAEDFMFTKCDANGNFKFTNVPGGNWRVTLGDQWNDGIIDGLSTPANVGCIPTPPATTCPTGTITDLKMGQVGVQQWQANLYTRTFIDDNKNGIWDKGEIGIPFLYNMIHYRDGHNANALVTDFNGVANFNETFPLFNWYVVEAEDSATATRYKRTGIHTVYDAGGPADGTTYCGPGNGGRPCGASTAYNYLANTYEAVPLPADLSVPGAVYCASADCAAEATSFANATPIPSPGTGSTASTGRIDPPWVWAEGWSGVTSAGNWIDFGLAPYASCPPACATVTIPAPPGSTTGTQPTTLQVGENGGIHGIVDYASTRPFDSASQMIQQPWEPFVPGVTINLYQEGFAADGVTPTLTLVDTTQTSSWDDWAQGFYPNSAAGSGTGAGQKPYLNCPGQGLASGGNNQDLFFFTLNDQPNWLDWYNHEHNGGTLHTLPYNSQFKCYDAMKIWNQVQPAVFDGKYSFPSVLGINTQTGKPDATLMGGVGGNGPSTPGYVAATMGGTNCIICVANPDSTDKWRVGTPMLPPGKYVVQVLMPPGYEVYKEEDKNLLIGDNYIAPVTQQFPGLGGSIFIMPDQASVASLYDPSASGYNPNNFQNETTGLGLSEELSGVPGFPGFQEPVWPCVGETRTVPDYLSLFPQVHEVAPFAGAARPLCDRKEVTLASQMSVSAKFYIYTSTHIASKFTGVITDDFTSEFDPFAPQFGEKFAPSNMPISTKDYLGNEISRVYSDHYGIYDGLTYSSWEVNPPNITGYSPTIMVQCMNDPGPIPDGKGGLMNDPLYQPAYSAFCYEEPYMPGLTTYLDTPVVPTQAFVGAGYNNPDCAYPDATPAISEVDGDGIGPWVGAPGHTLTITSLPDQPVTNYAYGGPSASVAPFNMKNVNRHFGFGSQCTALSSTCTSVSSVTIGGVAAIINSWADNQITVAVPGPVPGTCTTASATCNPTPVPACSIQQQAQYGGPGVTGTPAECGELVITAGNSKQSIDAVTITVGGKQPTHVPATGTIQAAIDAASPGDLIIVDPTCTTSTSATTGSACSGTGVGTISSKAAASHTEMLIMWKPVRLQGVGAATTIINANANPAGKLLDPWRRHINCMFGLTISGVPSGNTTPYDPNGTYSCPDTSGGPVNGFSAKGQVVDPTTGQVTSGSSPQIDRLPLEATVGWDASLNGNLAEQLQEPSLMGAYEGAGITVLAKGLDFHGANPWNDANEAGAFPTVTTLISGVVSNPGGTPGTAGALTVGDANSYCGASGTNPFPSNFMCNPSSIDGLSVTNSSQGGGGIFVHGWAHFLQIANNRIYNNAGTLSGGISVGQGEFAPPYIMGGATNAAPGTCSDGTGFVTNQHEPFCLQLQVGVHNNMIVDNSSIGDELFSATLAGGGGATFCTGNDYYKFNYNWVCGNISAGEGGGLVHLGEIQNGDIEHNSFVFNQSSNPTIPTNGGGIQVMGTPDTDPVCSGVPDTDCPPGLSDGTGKGLLINANLIQGNSADSGSGGGIRLQQVNGTEVGTFASQPQVWNDATITNNIIVNNMAGWDGAGISLQDALNVKIINNTVMHNTTLATSGVLTNSLGAPLASAPPGTCTMIGPNGVPDTASCPQSAGVTSTLNSSLMAQATSGLTLTCPNGLPGCGAFSNPVIANDLIWQNTSFYVGVGNLGTGNLNQQALVTLYNAFVSTPAPVQTATGGCAASSGNYWEVGVRGDKTINGHESGFRLSPTYSALTDASDYPGSHNLGSDPAVASQYCNGSRVPPECTSSDGCAGPHGFGVPPGIADALAPNPVFSLTPSATVDEGNNWINVSWGPLSLTNPSLLGADGNYGGGPSLGNYVLSSGSPAIDYIPSTSPTYAIAPTTDFFGNPRPDHPGSQIDVGAVEAVGSLNPAAAVSTNSLSFPNTLVGTTSGAQSVTLSNAGDAPLLISGIVLSDPADYSMSACPASLAPGGTCIISVTFHPATTGLKTATITINSNDPSSASTIVVGLTGSGVAPLMQLSATSLTFNTSQGTTSAPQTVTATNAGTAPLFFSSVTLTGTNASQFHITSNTCPIGGAGVAAGGTCNITLTFAPPLFSGSTARTAQLNVNVLAPAANGSVALTGDVPAMSVTPSSHGFGNQVVNTTSAAFAFTVRNTGSGPLVISGITTPTLLGGSGFAQTVLTGQTVCPIGGTGLAAGASCTVNVTFTPTTTGTKLGALVVAGPALTSSGAAALTGTGVTPVSFSGPTPALNTGGTSTKNGTVTVTNNMTSNLTFSSTVPPSLVKTSGTGTGTASVQPGGTCTLGHVVAAGGTCTINVRWAPTNSSTANLTLTITDSGAPTTTQSTSFPAN